MRFIGPVYRVKGKECDRGIYHDEKRIFAKNAACLGK